MNTEPEMGPHSRDRVLEALRALSCDLRDQEGLGEFVERRAVLLAELDRMKEPWTQHQRSLLQEALRHGAQLLEEAQEHRRELARKIDTLRGSRKKHQSALNVLPPSWRKTF